jgi:hypothetical protein
VLPERQSGATTLSPLSAQCFRLLLLAVQERVVAAGGSLLSRLSTWKIVSDLRFGECSPLTTKGFGMVKAVVHTDTRRAEGCRT